MKELRNNYLILFIILNRLIISMHFYVFINSGNFTISFINVNFAILHYFSLQKLKNHLTLNIINNYIIKSSALIYYIKLIMRISHYIKKYIFLLTKLGHYLIIINL